ncbi:hypothetical protein GCM10009838_24630 [Catenulispora subtropica]|uniref:Uncharacterized protein n=1 Tax=Catenulispora subtropica TaxID=450798 RepID=A0ABP5CM76_9ACTN
MARLLRDSDITLKDRRGGRRRVPTPEAAADRRVRPFPYYTDDRLVADGGWRVVGFDEVLRQRFPQDPLALSSLPMTSDAAPEADQRSVTPADRDAHAVPAAPPGSQRERASNRSA